MRRHFFSLLFVVLAVAGGNTSNTVASENVASPGLESYTLGNGLRVVLMPDHKVPKVAVIVRYGVGSANEPSGRSGFAHLFEHLMYAGTPTYPAIDETLSAVGLINNAQTTEDGTIYYASGISSALPVILSVHADQMANIGAAASEEDLALQRSVVINEMRQNVLDAPGGAAFTALQAGMFPKGHPYSRSASGSIADLEAATIGDVRSFFNAYYVPNNAMLVIVGDFDVGAARALIDETFGRIVKGIAVPAPEAAAFAPVAARFDVTDAVSTPVVYLGFTGPGSGAGQDAELHIAGDLLSNEAGVLRDLVTEGIAIYSGAYWMPGNLGGRFFVVAGAAPGVTAEQLEVRLKAAVAGFAAAPIDRADFERSRSTFLLAYRAALEAFETRAAYVSDIVATTGDVSRVLKDNADIAGATAEATERAIADVLVLGEASVAIIRPGARGNLPAVLSDSSGEPEAIVAPDRAAVEIPVLAAGEPQAATLPVREVSTLSNGIEVIHYRMKGAPLAYLTVSVSGGSDSDPRGKEGLYDLALGMGWRGAGERNLEEFGRAVRDIGGGMGTWVGTNASGATLSIVPENLSQGIDLLADVIRRPRFDEDQWAALKADMLDLLVQRDSNPASVAQRALNGLVFFPGADDSRLNASVASVESVTRAEAMDAYKRLFTPKTMTVYSVGDLPLETVTAALEAKFGTWQDEGPGVAEKPLLTPIFPPRQRVVVVPMPGTRQATILISRPAPGYDDPGFVASTAATNLLAGDFLSRLNSVIREERGYTYGVSGRIWNWLRHDGGLSVDIPVQNDAVGAALEEAFAGFESLTSDAVTEAELNRSLMLYLAAQASLPETAYGFFNALIGWEQAGIGLDSMIGFIERMSELELADVRAAASSLAGLDRAVIVVVGDPDAILPQLAVIGIGDVEILEIADFEGDH